MSQRISERIGVHEAAASVLDARIKKRAGDQPFDIRVNDGLETFGELQVERERYRSLLTRLVLLRDSIVVMAVLEFIRDRIEPGAIYRLGEADLLFGELLPEKPAWLEQQEYEERTGVGFHLERLAKSVGALLPMDIALLAREHCAAETLHP